MEGSTVDSNQSVCILPDNTRLYGRSACRQGEVHLLGDYLQLGIHNVASFGTQATLTTSYFNDRLGFIADYDRNGFVGSPGYAGDYFIPGYPLEGKQ